MKKAATKQTKLKQLQESIQTLKNENLPITYQNIGRVEYLHKKGITPTARSILSLEGPHKQRAHARYATDFADVIAGNRIAAIDFQTLSHDSSEEECEALVVPKARKTVLREKQCEKKARMSLKIGSETFSTVHKR